MFFFSPLDLLFLLPALAFSLFAQYKVWSTYSRYSRERASSGLTAAQAARRLLDRAGLYHVKVEAVPGQLTDHYDPRSKTLRLSAPESTSVAAIGVAAHEAGHAIQDAQGYAPLVLRNAMVPVANFGSMLAFPLLIAGFLLNMGGLIWMGIIVFSAAVLFTLITLPVEFDASRRAVRILSEGGAIVSPSELGMVRKVLNAAALTYVAAAATAVLELIRLVLIARSSER
ncbi:MAG: zinc metallopeptidase [Candidatus Bipolaricaulota bacterium]|nr:zinc metallopeptidase [Candidatus Bipolaricaulota bacterium]MCS7274205.1 zinc metallopeptidase [Candidatus Bipolaricaulota bacterium]MDW8110629.1 zinc metallopeptidase [Candidatus Bipolaricaulota bacterium]MDW8328513.1 zinc metallopeptidase [Candidatus Bipolaricaulota bacterium]